ncbi:uncharacterized protein IUM83_04952 [Phytophthora cinnamomi]|uniref:uncharacterized protein n=1 Tax=Phytophthora cinnamomi TaxID=4785 RepID=UPI00355A41AB|nr:hypothetical protein IUM83_04952 [Phytophthora cinnamomi]
MLQLSALGLASAFGEEASEIERYRARQRLLSRALPPQSSAPSAWTEDSDERRRKTSAKRQQQRLTVLSCQHEDGRWPEPAGTEMRVGFNAFDSSASPEVFDHVQKPETQAAPTTARPCSVQRECHRPTSSVEKAVAAMGFPVLQWAPGLQHPSTLCEYAPLQLEEDSHQRYGLYCHRPRYY